MSSTATISIFLGILLTTINAVPYSKYGRSCKDIGCRSNEVCVMAEDPCSIHQRDSCGRYPTCQISSNGGESCTTKICPTGQYCKTENGRPTCINTTPALVEEMFTEEDISEEKNLVRRDEESQKNGGNGENPLKSDYPKSYPSQDDKKLMSSSPSYSGYSASSSYPSGSGYPDSNSPKNNPNPASNSAGLGYPSRSGYPDLNSPKNNPTPTSNSPGSGYPSGSGYPKNPGYPSGPAYPTSSGYPASSGYPLSESGYPANSNSPNNRISPKQSGYPNYPSQAPPNSGYPSYPSSGSRYPNSDDSIRRTSTNMNNAGYPGQGYPAQYPYNNPYGSYPSNSQGGYHNQAGINQNYPPPNQGGYPAQGGYNANYGPPTTKKPSITDQITQYAKTIAQRVLTQAIIDKVSGRI